MLSSLLNLHLVDEAFFFEFELGELRAKTVDFLADLGGCIVGPF